MTYWNFEILFFILVAVTLLGILYYPYITNPWRRKRAPKVEPQDMNQTQRQGILYGAFLSFRNGDKPFDSLSAKINYVRYKRCLRRDWGIKGRESALPTLDMLARLEMTAEMDLALQADFSSQAKAVEKVSKKLGYCPYREPSEFTTYAWDVGRLSVLAKWCFWLGYITEQELDRYYEACIDRVTALGRDWDEYAYSYLLGRVMHGFGLQEFPKVINIVLPKLKQHPFKTE